MKILLIEDDATARYAMHRALKASGREILEAVDGETGVASILADCPDLVFLDLNMPNRDGLAVLG